MKTHEADVLEAEAYARAHLADFPRLTPEQLSELRHRARILGQWTYEHPALHNAISAAVLAGLFAVDLFVLLGLPWALLPASPGLAAQAGTGALCGALHGWLVCSIVTYSLHEGAAHDRIVMGRGRAAAVARALAHNACRLFVADPECYTGSHAAHHRALGSRADASFTHSVRPGRLARALLPLAPLASDSDFFPWRPQEQTPSRRLSARLGGLWLAGCTALAWASHGPVYAVVALLIVGSWVSFALDRLRESTEHLHMPLDPRNGTRSLGLGLWGLLLGGGPWGQPCHLAHHLAPALPWYQQIALHFQLKRMLTDQQRRAFFPRPIVGVPLLWWSLLNGPTGSD